MSQVSQAIKVLRRGGVVIFPTDTVWGMGVAADNPAAIKKFYRIKRREKDKPTAILVADLAQAEELGEFDDEVREVAKKYWPGALTIIVSAKQGGTVGLRVPDWPLVQELCRKLGAGIMAGSANFAGKPAPMKREELDPKLVEMVDLIIEEPYFAKATQGKASTVMDTMVEPWKVVRQGSVRVEL